eukprot:UN15100
MYKIVDNTGFGNLGENHKMYWGVSAKCMLTRTCPGGERF